MTKSLRFERTGWSRLMTNGLVSLAVLLPATLTGCGGGSQAPQASADTPSTTDTASKKTGPGAKKKVDTTSRREKHKQQAAPK